MLLKVTIILWILVACMKFIAGIVMDSMSTEEKLLFKLKHLMPMRVIVSISMWLLSILAAIVCTIVTIVKL
jgi:hypothetical protein